MGAEFLTGVVLAPAVGRTVLNKADVADNQFTDRQLHLFAGAYDRVRVVRVDLALKTSELSLFLPVVDRRHHHDQNDGAQYGDSVDPAVFFLFLDPGRESCTSHGTHHKEHQQHKQHKLTLLEPSKYSATTSKFDYCNSLYYLSLIHI